MTFKTGSVVSHTGAQEWGAGKVTEVTAARVTIMFSDGRERKIAASHFESLVPAQASAFVAPSETAPAAKPARSKAAAKKK